MSPQAEYQNRFAECFAADSPDMEETTQQHRATSLRINLFHTLTEQIRYVCEH